MSPLANQAQKTENGVFPHELRLSVLSAPLPTHPCTPTRLLPGPCWTDSWTPAPIDNSTLLASDGSEESEVAIPMSHLEEDHKTHPAFLLLRSPLFPELLHCHFLGIMWSEPQGH